MRSAVTNNIALLIFANSPEAERERKVVGGSDEIFTLLTEHSIKLARQLQIPFYHFTEKEQVGDSFGERYTHAIKQIFELGYEGLITIGNDTPALNISHLKDALNSLKKGQTALGPSEDGGFYLLAISRAAFFEEKFKTVSWNTHKVFAQMLKYLHEGRQEIQVLQPLLDLDTTEDIAKVVAQSVIIPIGIYKLLLRCSPKQKIDIPLLKTPFPLSLRGGVHTRGSPAFSL